jgi:hypothetical protein
MVVIVRLTRWPGRRGGFVGHGIVVTVASAPAKSVGLVGIDSGVHVIANASS